MTPMEKDNVANFSLTAESFAGGVATSIGGTEIREISNLEISTIACRRGNFTMVQNRMTATLGISLPIVGCSVKIFDGQCALLTKSIDQWLVISYLDHLQNHDQLKNAVGRHAYLTCQTDNWVAFRITGSLSRATLERGCMIDLHPTVFLEGSFAQTLINHFDVVVFCEQTDRFLLLSPSSSAKSFYAMIETSLRNVS